MSCRRLHETYQKIQKLKKENKLKRSWNNKEWNCILFLLVFVLLLIMLPLEKYYEIFYFKWRYLVYHDELCAFMGSSCYSPTLNEENSFVWCSRKPMSRLIMHPKKLEEYMSIDTNQPRIPSNCENENSKQLNNSFWLLWSNYLQEANI